MRRLAAVAAENRADIVAAALQVRLRRLHDAEIDLVAGFHLHRIFGAERVVLLGGAPDEIRGWLHLHGLAQRRLDHLVRLGELVGLLFALSCAPSTIMVAVRCQDLTA